MNLTQEQDGRTARGRFLIGVLLTAVVGGLGVVSHAQDDEPLFITTRVSGGGSFGGQCTTGRCGCSLSGGPDDSWSGWCEAGDVDCDSPVCGLGVHAKLSQDGSIFSVSYWFGSASNACDGGGSGSWSIHFPAGVPIQIDSVDTGWEGSWEFDGVAFNGPTVFGPFETAGVHWIGSYARACSEAAMTLSVPGGGMYNDNSNPLLMNTIMCGNAPNQIDGQWTDNGDNKIATSCDCPTDINGDGIVNGADLTFLFGFWGTNDAVADVNNDGVVDGADLNVILASWGTCT